MQEQKSTRKGCGNNASGGKPTLPPKKAGQPKSNPLAQKRGHDQRGLTRHAPLLESWFLVGAPQMSRKKKIAKSEKYFNIFSAFWREDCSSHVYGSLTHARITHSKL
jgi:hypothetical protein